MCLTYTKNCILLAPDTINVGGAGTIQMTGLPPGYFYQMAASFGQTPLNLGRCTVYLTPDNLFLLSVLTGPPLFLGYAGSIPTSGTVVGTVRVLNIPQLVGLDIYHGGVVYSGTQGVICCTNTAGTRLVP